MKTLRVAYNFADEFAFPDHWHAEGKRYLTFQCTIAISEDPAPALERLARILSPDDRFAVDLLELGARQEGKTISVRAYVFKHCPADDHRFHLGSLEETEVDEIIALLTATETVLRGAATELISTQTRGNPVITRRFGLQAGPHR